MRNYSLYVKFNALIVGTIFICGLLYVKFNALIVGTIFICGLLIGSLLLYTTSSEMERELDKSGVEIGQTMSAVISSDILLDDRFSMTERLMQIQSLNDQIRYIIVFHPNGQILASTFTNGIPKGLPLVREPKPGVTVDTVTFDSNEGYIREVLCPIDFPHRPVGKDDDAGHAAPLSGNDHPHHPHLPRLFVAGYALRPQLPQAHPADGRRRAPAGTGQLSGKGAGKDA